MYINNCRHPAAPSLGLHKSSFHSWIHIGNCVWSLAEANFTAGNIHLNKNSSQITIKLQSSRNRYFTSLCNGHKAAVTSWSVVSAVVRYLRPALFRRACSCYWISKRAHGNRGIWNSIWSRINDWRGPFLQTVILILRGWFPMWKYHWVNDERFYDKRENVHFLF